MNLTRTEMLGMVSRISVKPQEDPEKYIREFAQAFSWETAGAIFQCLSDAWMLDHDTFDRGGDSGANERLARLLFALMDDIFCADNEVSE